MNAPKECFHNHTNVFIRVDGTQQLNGPQNLTVILQDACCVQAQQYLGQCEKKKTGIRTASIECFHGHTNGFRELTVVTGTWRSDESMGPTSHSLRPMVCSSSDVSRIVGNEIGLTTTPIECFHELISVVGTQSSDGSMGPTSYSLGPILCSCSENSAE